MLEGIRAFPLRTCGHGRSVVPVEWVVRVVAVRVPWGGGLDEEEAGSGFLIPIAGEMVLVTAAHVVCDTGACFVDEVIAQVWRTDGKRVDLWGAAVAYPEDWNDPIRMRDLAVVRMHRALPAVVGGRPAGLAEGELSGRLYGYPTWDDFWAHRNDGLDLDVRAGPKRISYPTRSLEGHSGGPLVIAGSVVGIHGAWDDWGYASPLRVDLLATCAERAGQKIGGTRWKS